MLPESDGVRYNACEAGSSRLVLRKPKHMAVFKNDQGVRYTLATMHQDLLDAKQEIAQLKRAGDGYISQQEYVELVRYIGKDIAKRFGDHNKHFNEAVRDLYRAGFNTGKWFNGQYNRFLA